VRRFAKVACRFEVVLNNCRQEIETLVDSSRPCSYSAETSTPGHDAGPTSPSVTSVPPGPVLGSGTLGSALAAGGHFAGRARPSLRHRAAGLKFEWVFRMVRTSLRALH
jgi:hypothetical protein